MGGMSCCVAWNVSFGKWAETLLSNALDPLGCQLQELPSQVWDPKAATIGGVRDYKLAFIAKAGLNWSFLLLPSDFCHGETLAASISNAMGGTSIALFEYDQAAWAYSIYSKGAFVDRFSNYPDISGDDSAMSTGHPEKVASIFNVPVSQVAPYLQRTGPALVGVRAFPNDQATLDNHWVRVDFLRNLGIEYPIPGSQGNGRHLLIKGVY